MVGKKIKKAVLEESIDKFVQRMVTQYKKINDKLGNRVTSIDVSAIYLRLNDSYKTVKDMSTRTREYYDREFNPTERSLILNTLKEQYGVDLQKISKFTRTRTPGNPEILDCNYQVP